MEKSHDEKAPEKTEKQMVKEPEKPDINVSSKRDPRSYKIVCKLAIRKFGYCVLRSLGNASEAVVKIAESLSRDELAVVEKIESAVTVIEDTQNDVGSRESITFVVRLGKGPKFNELTVNLE